MLGQRRGEAEGVGPSVPHRWPEIACPGCPSRAWGDGEKGAYPPGLHSAWMWDLAEPHRCPWALKQTLPDKHPGSPLSEATGKVLALISKPHLTQQFGHLRQLGCLAAHTSPTRHPVTGAGAGAQCEGRGHSSKRKMNLGLHPPQQDWYRLLAGRRESEDQDLPVRDKETQPQCVV